MFASRVAMRQTKTAAPPLGKRNIFVPLSAPSDACEREADRMADETRMTMARDFPANGAPERVEGIGATSRSVVRPALGPGEPLERVARRFFEPRFGVDLSHVRVHAGSAANGTAEALDALAFTQGEDIVFGPSRYAFHTDDGRRLLAHELAHVVQHRRGGVNGNVLHRKAKAIRFQEEPTLDRLSEGKVILKEGDKGEAVIRITTALAELDFYTNPVIDESYDPPLTSAVVAFQKAKLPAGTSNSGSVDKATFGKLDAEFDAKYTVERSVIGAQSAADPTRGTQALDPAEKAASARTISTKLPVSSVTGLLPTFRNNIPGKGLYKDRLTAVVDKVIVDEFSAMGKGKTAAHADPAKLYAWKQIEVIAGESQKAVDRVFGVYYASAPRPQLKKGVNIFDAFADKVSMYSVGGKTVEDARVAWRVEKIRTSDDAVAALDREHGAIQSRPAEAAIASAVQAAMIAKHRAELIETDKGWPGFAGSGGRIFIQLFKSDSAERRRADMWGFYQTFVHEYIHTLEHAKHVTYRETMDEQTGNKALREGVTDYFTKIVWNGIALDDALRTTIEGPFNDPAKKFAVPRLDTYRESENAERLAGVVGVRNVAAAFFLGRVDLIGKP